MTQQVVDLGLVVGHNDVLDGSRIILACHGVQTPFERPAPPGDSQYRDPGVCNHFSPVVGRPLVSGSRRASDDDRRGLPEQTDPAG